MKEKLDFISKRILLSWVGVTVGTLCVSLSYNLFIAPQNLFGGGYTGISQIIAGILRDDLKWSVAIKYDLTGIILWLLNIPLLIIVYRKLSHMIFIKSVYIVILMSFIMSIFPHVDPVIHDRLTSCMVGGAMTGFGIGTILRNGGTGGGTDILGLLISKAKPGASVGKLAITINACIYLYGGIRYNPEIAVYSMIFAITSNLVLDRVHYQNIQTAVIIISKDPTIGHEINVDLKRGVTCWKGIGEYTKEENLIYLTVISKYEAHRLTNLVHRIDPHAFLIFDDHREVVGNFEKRFDS